MPGLDRTGPVGEGSMTGRKMGKCNPDNKRENNEDIGIDHESGAGAGRGAGRGFGRGFGAGVGRGQGRGLGKGLGRGRGFGRGPGRGPGRGNRNQ